MTRLRIALPPLAQLNAESPVRFAWLDRAGQVSRQGRGSLKDVAQKVAKAECFLHPQDSLMTRLELPQLPAAKVAAAVACAAQALILGPLELMQVAHGPRESNGEVQIGWLSTHQLAHLSQVLAQVQLKPSGVYPAPYALAVPAAGQLTAALVDGQLLLRHSLHQGAVHPLGQPALHALSSQGLDLLQLDDDAPQRWSGAAPGWGLHGRFKGTGSTVGWGRALGCTAVAVAIWTLGLNLYAARQVDAGQQLKAQMIQQVRQAFPELPVILNPLQQARQQLAARQADGGEPGQRFTRLLQVAGSSMPFMVASVDSLVFEHGQLRLNLLADTRSPAVAGDWQAALAQAGFSAGRDEHGWTLGPLAEPLDSGATEAVDDE